MFTINQAFYHHNEMTHLTSFDMENIIATTDQKIVKLNTLRTFIHNQQLLLQSIAERSQLSIMKTNAFNAVNKENFIIPLTIFVKLVK